MHCQLTVDEHEFFKDVQLANLFAKYLSYEYGRAFKCYYHYCYCYQMQNKMINSINFCFMSAWK